MLPLSLLLSAAVAVTAGRPISDPSLGPSAYPQSLATIASNDDGFLAVWRTESYGGGTHIDGALLDCNGNRISPAALRIISFANPSSIQLMPFDDHYVLAWTNLASTLHVVEVSAAGKQIRELFAQQRPLFRGTRLFWNGEHFLELEQTSLEPNPGARLTVTTLNRAGAIVGSEIALDKVVISNSAVAPSGIGFVLATTGTEGLALRRISSEGHVGTPIIVDVHQPFALPLLSSDGTDVIIAWQNVGPQITPSIQAARVTLDGQVDIHPPVEIAYYTSLYPRILRADSRLALLLNTHEGPAQKTATPEVLELDREGTPLGSPVPMITAGENRNVQAAATCGETLYVLGSGSTGTALLGISFSIPQNKPVRAELLPLTPARQNNPVVASDGVNSMAVWIDQTAERESLRGRVISRDGSPISDEITLTTVQGSLGPPAIAYGNGEYLIVWQNGNQLLARRATTNGLLLEDAPFVVANVASFAAPAVVSNGSQFLVAWVAGKIVGALVSPQANVSFLGQLSNDPAPPPNWTFGDASPSIAWDGAEFILAWTFSRAPICVYAGLFGCTYLSDVRAIRLDRFGSVTDAQSTLVSEDAQRASLASNGRNVLAAIDDEDGTHASLIDARTSTMRVAPPIAVFDTWTLPRSSVVWDGSMYEVVWRTAMPDGWHLDMVGISEDGVRGQPTGLLTDPGETTTPPGVSSNGLIVTSEIQHADVSAASARTVAHRVNEMTALPQPPTPPVIVDAVHTSPYVVVVTWKDQSEDEEGFVIEQKTAPGDYYVATTVPANAEQATVSFGGVVRVRAWNAGGMSAPSSEMEPHAPPRRRTIATK